MVLGKRFLQSDIGARSGGPITHIGIDHAAFVHREMVEIEGRRHLQEPVERSERGIPFEELQAQHDILPYKELIVTAEKVGAVRPLGRHPGGDREFTKFGQRIADSRETEEGMLPDNRVVALQYIGLVGIKQVALVAKKTPAILDRRERVWLPRLRRQLLVGRRLPVRPARQPLRHGSCIRRHAP